MGAPNIESRRFYLFAMLLHGRTTGLDSGGVLCAATQSFSRERALRALVDADEALRVYETNPSPIFPEMEPSA